MAECYCPFQLYQEELGKNVYVPCGKCPACRSRRASAWSFRLCQEARNSFFSQFITLTYDTRHVPITNAGYMGLSFRDLALFFKRLRKAHPKSDYRIKYYAVGEYGGRTYRPHYHVLLFNAQLELIQKAWDKGSIHYDGPVDGAKAGYCLKYMTKTPRIPMHKNDDRTPEDGRYSKGLGKSYITPEMVKFHNEHSDNMYCLTDQNQKIAMPRYYKNLIYPEYKRKAFGAINAEKFIKKHDKDLLKNPEYHAQKLQAELHAWTIQSQTKKDVL